VRRVLHEPWRHALRQRRTEPLTLEHVVWIGGAPASGKTAVARLLAGKYDLRAYHADAFTQVHHRRALDAELPAAVRWERATPDERWLEASPRELAEWSVELNAGRFRMILEDLAALPDVPGIVVEGTPLLPWLVAPFVVSPRNAVWLVPTAEFTRARLLERRPLAGFVESSDAERASETRIAREHLFTDEIATRLHELDLPVVQVDESRGLHATVAAVEEELAPALARLPRASTREERTALRHEQNAAVVRQARLHHEAHPTVGQATYEFACECGASGCTATAHLTVPAYERRAPIVDSKP
jgi:hypothetical protein